MIQKSLKRFVNTLLIVLFLFISNNFTNASIFTIPQSIVNTVVFIMNGNKAEGSGFLIGLREDDLTYCYLVSAKHVIVPIMSDGRKEITIRVNKKDGKGATTATFNTDIYDGKRWLEHSNKSVDVAVVPLSIFDNDDPLKFINSHDIVMHTINGAADEYLAIKEWIEKNNIARGDEVFLLGLVPYLYKEFETNHVLSRFGKISLLEQNELYLPCLGENSFLPGGLQKAYFIDCQSFGGNSGGPVYVLLLDRPNIGSWKIALLGIVTEFVPSLLRMNEVNPKELGEDGKLGKVLKLKNEKNKANTVELEDKEKQTETGLILIENTGISKVVPVDYLVDILYSDILKPSRKQYSKFLKDKAKQNK